MEAATTFAALDWLVLGAYLAAVLTIGLASSRRRAGGDEFFLASRGMPVWAVALSVLATSQSAATFLGAPESAFRGDLTYLSANLGGLIAVAVTIAFFVPAFYRQGVTSVYELLGREMGPAAQRSASAAFMVGRVFASGARLFIVAIPFSLIAFGTLKPAALVLSILLAAGAATAYALAGGIRAVIWTDALQAVIYVGTAVAAFVVLWNRVQLPPGELVAALRESGDAAKLTVVDAGFDPTFTRPFNLWAVLIGLSLVNLAAFGTDQDLTQRLLTCRSAVRGGWSLATAYALSWPVVGLFLVVGLLLHVFYSRPELVGGAGPAVETVVDSRRVFVDFIVTEMPVGLRGLMMAGLFATAMSSLDSALTAMASTTIADFYRPLAARRAADPQRAARRELRAGRVAVAAWAIALAGFASLCVWWQARSGTALIDFALQVMVFAYSGLLAVFLAALFTRRGNALSAAAALVTGFATVLAMQATDLAFPWQMPIATALAFAVCCLGRRAPAAA